MTERKVLYSPPWRRHSCLPRRDSSRRPGGFLHYPRGRDESRPGRLKPAPRRGGRGFVFTGDDFHKNLYVEPHRRVLANGIAWTGKIDVPSGGIACEVPADAVK